MTRKKLFLILAASTAMSALALSAARARDVPKVATGFVANVICTETFVSGLDPARVFSETTAAMPGVGLITWALDYRVDRARKDVTVTLFGIGKSHAVFRGEGSAAISIMAARSPISRCRRWTRSPRCCLRSQVPPSLRRRRRNSPPRSIAPLPSRTSQRRATPARSWC